MDCLDVQSSDETQEIAQNQVPIYYYKDDFFRSESKLPLEAQEYRETEISPNAVPSSIDTHHSVFVPMDWNRTQKHLFDNVMNELSLLDTANAQKLVIKPIILPALTFIAIEQKNWIRVTSLNYYFTLSLKQENWIELLLQGLHQLQVTKLYLMGRETYIFLKTAIPDIIMKFDIEINEAGRTDYQRCTYCKRFSCSIRKTLIGFKTLFSQVFVHENV